MTRREPLFGSPPMLGASPASSQNRDATTLAITRAVADHWRKAALTYHGRMVPGELMAHPLCCVLAALDGKSARPDDFGVDPRSVEGLRIEGLGYEEAGALMRAERASDALTSSTPPEPTGEGDPKDSAVSSAEAAV